MQTPLQTPLKTPETVLQAEFVDPATVVATPQPTWQRRKNGVGYTFHKELAQLEGHLDQKFTGLHHHVHQQSQTNQNAIGQWFGILDENVSHQFQALDRKLSQKLNLVLATQRAQASRRSLLWLMGTLAAAGVYIIVLHPLLSPPRTQSVSSPDLSPSASTPTALPTPNPPLPSDVSTP
ncbi:MAG: hypothetical protein ACPGVO_20895 [Spirulinaceae cyanobacterium]